MLASCNERLLRSSFPFAAAAVAGVLMNLLDLHFVKEKVSNWIFDSVCESEWV